jgi:hypothetical protein
MPTFIKTGYWDKLSVAPKNYLNLDLLIASETSSIIPSQSGNNGKYLTTNGSTLSWGTVSAPNIYTNNGVLTADRTVDSGGFTLRLNPTLIQGATFRGYVNKPIVSGFGTTSSLNSILASDVDATYTGSALTDLFGMYHSAYVTNSGAGGNQLVRGRGNQIDLTIRGQTASSYLALTGSTFFIIRKDATDISSNVNNGLVGIDVNIRHDFSSDATIYTGLVYGYNNIIINSTGTMNNVYGHRQYLVLSNGSNNKNSVVNNYYANFTGGIIGRASGPTGIVTNYYGLFLETLTVGATGTITNRWGIYAPDAAMNHYFNGKLLIGTTTSGTSKVRIVGLPTSSAGLVSGELWNDAGVVKIIP